MKSTVSFRTQRIEKNDFDNKAISYDEIIYTNHVFVPNLKYDFIFMLYSIKNKAISQIHKRI